MAQIDLNNLEKIEKERNVLHEKVFTTYSVFEHEGEKIVQSDTYGKKGRENPGKLSQSIQLDRQTAKWLVEVLVEEFLG